MLENRELIAALLGVVVFFWFYLIREQLIELPHWRILLISFGLFAASLVCSVVEVFVWEDGVNFMEHALLMTSTVVIAIWSWLLFVRGNGETA